MVLAVDPVPNRTGNYGPEAPIPVVVPVVYSQTFGVDDGSEALPASPVAFSPFPAPNTISSTWDNQTSLGGTTWHYSLGFTQAGGEGVGTLTLQIQQSTNGGPFADVGFPLTVTIGPNQSVAVTGIKDVLGDGLTVMRLTYQSDVALVLQGGAHVVRFATLTHP